MGFWDSLFGVSRQDSAPIRRSGRPPTEDEYAVDRYRYLLRTAPPDQVEQVHAEAFAKLTPAQRKILHEQLSAAVMVEDRPADDEPQTLARSATRAELRQPGTMEGVLASPALGSSFGANFASSMFGSIVGYVVASSIMHAFLPPVDASTFYDQGYDDAGTADVTAGGGYDGGGDIASGDLASGDLGGDFGGFDGGFDF